MARYALHKLLNERYAVVVLLHQVFDNRRYSELALILRSRFLVDIDSYSEVNGQPLKPATIERVVLDKLQPMEAQS